MNPKFGNASNIPLRDLPLGEHPKSFSKSKSICVSTWRKSPWIRAIWTPPGGRKKGRLCFIKRKDKRYISNNRNFKQENIGFLRRKRTAAKTCGLFLDSSLVLCFSSLVSAESRDPFPHSPPAALLARADTLANGHAPAHRALNDFAFLAFTLHLHTQPSDNLPVVSEQKHDFNTSPVKVKRVKPSHLYLCSSSYYPRKVKR